jgi:uncharacterized membrane protein YgdD (TMEM256/DUF423 family)
MNNFEGIIALSIPIIGTIGAFTMIVMLRSYSNKERMAMIERGMNPADLKVWAQKRYDPFQWVRFGCTAVGIGTGLFVGNLLRATDLQLFDRGGIVGGLTFICGGLGLLAGFFVEYRLRKENNGKGIFNREDEGGLL